MHTANYSPLCLSYRWTDITVLVHVNEQIAVLASCESRDQKYTHNMIDLDAEKLRTRRRLGYPPQCKPACIWAYQACNPVTYHINYIQWCSFNHSIACRWLRFVITRTKSSFLYPGYLPSVQVSKRPPQFRMTISRLLTSILDNPGTAAHSTSNSMRFYSLELRYLDRPGMTKK